MRFAGRQRIRFFVLMAAIAVLGGASLVYVLVQQRLHNPLIETYVVQADLLEADGVVGGLGQPVNVAGVKVGSVSSADLVDGHARLTLEIQKALVPGVHRGASISLEPITPLKDMQVELNPGDPASPTLSPDDVIGVAVNTSPAPLANLLDSLDSDTRAYLASLIESVGAGSDGAGGDLRATLRAMAPASGQISRISRALEGRRTELAALVTNLAKVTSAASDDRQLAALIQSGEQTLQAIASQEGPLDSALAELPETLDETRAALDNAGGFSDQLGPALASIRPAIERLPQTLRAVRPFARVGAQRMQSDIRPLIRRLKPVAADLSAPLSALSKTSPDIWNTLKSLQFGLNEMAYNPPGRDEGGLFWTDWFAHNANSAFGGIGDAHGRSARSMILANCQEWAGFVGDLGSLLEAATGVANICPVTPPPVGDR